MKVSFATKMAKVVIRNDHKVNIVKCRKAITHGKTRGTAGIKTTRTVTNDDGLNNDDLDDNDTTAGQR
jgi:hypothetical protein